MSTLTRRGLIRGLLGTTALVAAPSIVRASSLMAVRPLPADALAGFTMTALPDGWEYTHPAGHHIRVVVAVQNADRELRAAA